MELEYVAWKSLPTFVSIAFSLAVGWCPMKWEFTVLGFGGLLGGSLKGNERSSLQTDRWFEIVQRGSNWSTALIAFLSVAHPLSHSVVVTGSWVLFVCLCVELNPRHIEHHSWTTKNNRPDCSSNNDLAKDDFAHRQKDRWEPNTTKSRRLEASPSWLLHVHEKRLAPIHWSLRRSTPGTNLGRNARRERERGRKTREIDTRRHARTQAIQAHWEEQTNERNKKSPLPEIQNGDKEGTRESLEENWLMRHYYTSSIRVNGKTPPHTNIILAPTGAFADVLDPTFQASKRPSWEGREHREDSGTSQPTGWSQTKPTNQPTSLCLMERRTTSWTAAKRRWHDWIGELTKSDRIVQT